MPIMKYLDPTSGGYEDLSAAGIGMGEADSRYTRLAVPDPTGATNAASKEYVDATDVVPFGTFTSGDTTTALTANAWTRVNPGGLTLTGGVKWDSTSLGFVLPVAGLYLIVLRAQVAPSAAMRLDTSITSPAYLPHTQTASHYIGGGAYMSNSCWTYTAVVPGEIVGMGLRANVTLSSNYNTMQIVRIGAQGESS